MVNVLYNDFESEFDKDLHIIESENSISIGRALLTLETCLNLQDIKYEEAELQCMKESGDMDRLCALYEEANAETADKEKGAIGKLFEAIASAFRKIKEFLFGKTLTPEQLEQAKQDQEEITVAKEDMDNANLITKTWDSIKGFFSNAKNAESNEAAIMKKIGIIGGIAAVGAAGTMVAYKTGAVAEACDKLKGIASSCASKADEFKNSEAQGVKGTFLKTIGGALNGVSKSITAIAGALVKPVKSKLEKANDALKKDNSDMSTSGGIEAKIKKLEAKRDATEDQAAKDKLSKDIKNLYAKMADVKAAGGKIEKAPEQSVDAQKKSLFDDLKAKKAAMNAESDPAKKAELEGQYKASKVKYDQFMSQHKGTKEAKPTNEYVDDFFNIEMPDEFVESAVEPSDIYDLLDSIM